MKKILYGIFILYISCSVMVFKGETEIVKERTKRAGAFYPEDPLIGANFKVVSRDRNAVFFSTLSAGNVWEGGFKEISPGLQMGVETEMSFLQGDINLGILPFYKKRPYVYPYIGIGAGVLSTEIYGEHKDDVFSMFYPFLKTGIHINYPFSKKILKGRKSQTSFSFVLDAGYQFSFERWLKGYYISFGYSLIVPPEGIWAFLLGGAILLFH